MAADIMQRLLFFAVEHLFALIIIAALLWQLYCCVYQIRHRRRLGLSLFTTYYIPSPFPFDHTPPPPPSSAHNTPLDPSLLHLLPTFTYSSAHHSHPQPECVICQSEFQDGDKGRVLPNCNHFLFHLDCIERWLREHSTCPLCRKIVDPPPKITLQLENTEASAGQEGQLENSSNVNLPPPIWCPKDTWQGIELEGVVIDIPEEDHRRRQSTSLRDSES